MDGSASRIPAVWTSLMLATALFSSRSSLTSLDTCFSLYSTDTWRWSRLSFGIRNICSVLIMDRLSCDVSLPAACATLWMVQWGNTATLITFTRVKLFFFFFYTFCCLSVGSVMLILCSWFSHYSSFTHGMTEYSRLTWQGLLWASFQLVVQWLQTRLLLEKPFHSSENIWGN